MLLIAIFSILQLVSYYVESYIQGHQSFSLLRYCTIVLHDIHGQTYYICGKCLRFIGAYEPQAYDDFRVKHDRMS
ncbi:hypothetical protein V8E53_011608 [Lactarius tabidus]|jgi:hypothetical protein